MPTLFESLFGTSSEKEIKKLKPKIQKINSLEEQFKSLSDDDLRAKTAEFKERLKNGETLDDILCEAFATVREASDRVLGMRHYDVQLIGGIVLHRGNIAEMKTGEGKTLVATLPAYLNALSGGGVHIVTVNEYLARRDSEWMGKIHRFLGLTVGINVHDMTPEEKRAAYACDITYGTNNEFGFDYLRDNMVVYKENMVQRDHEFAIVDEVDSILIDEARTPLIISGMGEEATTLYTDADRFARTLKMTKRTEVDSKEDMDEIDADYVIDEKARTVTLLASGIKKAEKYFAVENLSDIENTTLSHHINQAIRAHGIMQRDVDYVVRDGEILIVDEFTGRLMFGRRYSDGLHQAIEAKEGVKVEHESKTYATITFQNYFRMYKKLSGMTGTAMTEAGEFREIYRLDVTEIPTNRPMIRIDHEDSVFKTERGKFSAIIKQIEELHAKKQPVLVGTISIEKSEYLSDMLKRRGIKHQVLNAKHHEREALIVAQAGKEGAITIATNMAGRGTDIMLGGNAEHMALSELERLGYDKALISEATTMGKAPNEEIAEIRVKYKELYDKFREDIKSEAERVCESGGLFILGTERHESRRIDNQLRGRSGRQGDPGESKFFLSLEDDIMRLFGSERVMNMMNALGLPEDEPINHKMLTKAIETAQKRVEGKNFDIRKHVLLYDDVMNTQREVIYKQRRQVLDGENLKSQVLNMIDSVLDEAVLRYCGNGDIADYFDLKGIENEFKGLFLKGGEFDFSREELERLTREDVKELLKERAISAYEEKEAQVTPSVMRELERVIILQVVDQKWMSNLDDMEELRKGIGLRAYGQHDPLVEYKREGYDMFEGMIQSIKEDAVKLLFAARVKNEAPQRTQTAKNITAIGSDSEEKKPVKKGAKVGRNDPCPCGSGKKYKKCCGKNSNS